MREWRGDEFLKARGKRGSDLKVLRMPSRKVFKGKADGRGEREDIKGGGKDGAVGCGGGWRNSVSHEIELAVCNTFGFEDVAAVISSCTPSATRLERRKFSLASARGIFTINHGRWVLKHAMRARLLPFLLLQFNCSYYSRQRNPEFHPNGFLITHGRQEK